MADDLETDLSDTHHPKWSDRATRMDKQYTTMLRGMMARDYGRSPYRSIAYDRVASNQLGAEEAIRANSVAAYGGMNPSGRTGAFISQVRANAPYGQADIMAREAAQNNRIKLGQAALAKEQAIANRYVSLLNPYLQNKNIENQTALGLAQIEANSNLGIPSGGGSSSSDWLGPTIGALGSIGSAAIIASA